MNVIVFGATGSVGRLTVVRLLDEGHTVSAFSRRPGALDMEHPSLVLCPGDAMHAEQVSKAIQGHDAVVVVLGAGASRRSRVRSVGTLNIIRGMREQGVKRLICQTTLGLGESWGNLDFFWKYIMFGLLLKPVYTDHKVQERHVRESGLDWTIVRPSALTNAAADAGYQVDFPASERNLSLKIARSDVAAFLTRCLADASFMHRAVAISH